MRRLTVGKTYLSPSGRLCQVVPNPTSGVGSGNGFVCFMYLARSGQLSKEDGFILNADNEVVLKKFVELAR